MYTVGDVVEFIERHPERNKGFPDWSRQQIVNGVLSCMNNYTMMYSTNQSGGINGVMLATVNGDTMRVLAALTDGDDIGKKLFLTAVETFFNCKVICFKKRGIERKFPINKSLIKHLTH